MAIDSFLLTPEVWLNEIFSFLPFSSIENLLLVSKPLHALSREVIYPTRLGIFPVGVWLNYVLPLLSYKDLKKFQKVSQVAKKLTLSKKIAEQLFRSDVNLNDLKKIKSLKKGDSRLPEDNVGTINPFFRRILFRLRDTYDDIYVYDRNTFKTKSPTATHGLEGYKARNENACHPPVPVLLVVGFNENIFHVVGTGKALYGGKDLAVTCRDVMMALSEDCKQFEDCKCTE